MGLRLSTRTSRSWEPEKFYLVFSNLVGEEHYRNNIKSSTNSHCKVSVTQVTVTYPESLLSVTRRLQGPKDGPKAGWLRTQSLPHTGQTL